MATIKMKLGRKAALALVYKVWPKAKMSKPDIDQSVFFTYKGKIVAQFDSPSSELYYQSLDKEQSSVKKISVTVAAVRGVLAYTWYKVSKTMLGLTLRGKSIDLPVGTTIGLRPSTDGKSTRLVIGTSNLGMVYSPSKEQMNKILTRSTPLIGGSIDKEKVGYTVEPKVGIKAKRISEELELISSILQHGGPNSVTDLKVKSNKLFFKYNGRSFSVNPE
jgi:hypothetical protein